MAHRTTSSSATSRGEELAIEPIQRMDRNVFGVALLITSEAIFFLTLIITYIVYLGQSTSGPGPREVLNVPYTSFFTIFLFSSSASMALVTSHLHRNDASGVRRWLVVTIVLGAVFLLGQGYEYVRLYTDNITISRNLWGSTFFTLTGFHGLHVLVGLIAMAILVGLVRPGTDKPRAESGVESVSIYWHFVDAVWVVIFSVVYLWTLFQ
jgi:heme/copper-type cytochrome/quinol oxidase subunit 3